MSATSLVVSEPLGGSWWGHPRGNEIYHLLNEVAEHPQVLMVKLVSAKVTFVHQRLWPAVVMSSTEPVVVVVYGASSTV